MTSLISSQFLRFVASQPASVRAQIREIIESNMMSQSQKFQIIYYFVREKRYLPITSLDILTVVASISLPSTDHLA